MRAKLSGACACIISNWQRIEAPGLYDRALSAAVSRAAVRGINSGGGARGRIAKTTPRVRGITRRHDKGRKLDIPTSPDLPNDGQQIAAHARAMAVCGYCNAVAASQRTNQANLLHRIHVLR
jgi:hypothetical protein